MKILRSYLPIFIAIIAARLDAAATYPSLLGPSVIVSTHYQKSTSKNAPGYSNQLFPNYIEDITTWNCGILRTDYSASHVYTVKQGPVYNNQLTVSADYLGPLFGMQANFGFHETSQNGYTISHYHITSLDVSRKMSNGSDNEEYYSGSSVIVSNVISDTSETRIATLGGTTGYNFTLRIYCKAQIYVYSTGNFGVLGYASADSVTINGIQATAVPQYGAGVCYVDIIISPSTVWTERDVTVRVDGNPYNEYSYVLLQWMSANPLQ